MAYLRENRSNGLRCWIVALLIIDIYEFLLIGGIKYLTQIAKSVILIFVHEVFGCWKASVLGLLRPAQAVWTWLWLFISSSWVVLLETLCKVDFVKIVWGGLFFTIVDHLKRLFEIFLVYLCFLDWLGPHKHGANKLHIETRNQCAPVNKVRI